MGDDGASASVCGKHRGEISHRIKSPVGRKERKRGCGEEQRGKTAPGWHRMGTGSDAPGGAMGFGEEKRSHLQVTT